MRSLDLGMLCDPDTREPLRASGPEWRRSDGTVVDVVEGRPVLLPADSLFGVPRTVAGGSGGLGGRVKRLLPPTTLALGSAGHFARLAREARMGGGRVRPRILVIGGGILGQGMEALGEDPDVELIETDVYVGPRTQLVCDAHRLPFRDAAFDAVIAQAVLEHVADPGAVADEIRRVLRPGGLVYSEVPFMQQVHEGPYDFTRLTLNGHRRLFRWFDELESGVTCGPGTALAWSLRYFARSLPRRSGVSVRLLDALMRIVFCWLPQTDRLLSGHRHAEDAASGTYFLGRLRAGPLADAAVVDRYSGGQGVPSR